MQFFILGKTIDPDNDPKWVDAVCDIIDEAKSRDAVNDLSAIAYAILQQALRFEYDIKTDGTSSEHNL
jgi:hypothetical protein